MTTRTAQPGRTRLTIAVAQPPCRPYDVEGNARRHAAAVRAARARVVAFPELSLTGYELDSAPVTVDDARLAPLVHACAATGATAFVGAPVRGGGEHSHGDRRYLATLAVDASGVRVAYRKIWLGRAEQRWFAAGERPAVTTVDGWRLGLAICRDTGVARHAADTAALGMDVYVAATVTAAGAGEPQAERARRVAAGHGVWVAVANFAGPTGGGFHGTAGGSGIWAPGGRQLSRAGAEPGGIARAVLDRAAAAITGRG